MPFPVVRRRLGQSLDRNCTRNVFFFSPVSFHVSRTRPFHPAPSVCLTLEFPLACVVFPGPIARSTLPSRASTFPLPFHASFGSSFPFFHAPPSGTRTLAMGFDASFCAMASRAWSDLRGPIVLVLRRCPFVPSVRRLRVSIQGCSRTTPGVRPGVRPGRPGFDPRFAGQSEGKNRTVDSGPTISRGRTRRGGRGEAEVAGKRKVAWKDLEGTDPDARGWIGRRAWQEGRETCAKERKVRWMERPGKGDATDGVVPPNAKDDPVRTDPHDRDGCSQHARNRADGTIVLGWRERGRSMCDVTGRLHRTIAMCPASSPRRPARLGCPRPSATSLAMGRNVEHASVSIDKPRLPFSLIVPGL